MRLQQLPSRVRGLTLIELMIAVAVVAILASIAYPNYQDFVKKGRRADAQAFMLEVASRQQHWLVDRRSYAGSLSDLGLTAPQSVDGFYNVSVSAPVVAGAPPTFTVEAVPVGAQSTDACGTLSLNQAGTKSATGSTPSGGGCW